MYIYICAMRRVHGSSRLQREIIWEVAVHGQGFADNDADSIHHAPFLNPHPFRIVQEILDSQKSLLDVCPSSGFWFQTCDFHMFDELELHVGSNLCGEP